MDLELTIIRRGYQPLPQNFDKIVLDKKAMDKLRNLGIPYEQPQIRTRAVLDE